MEDRLRSLTLQPVDARIGVVDLRALKFVKRLPAGSDPEEFAVSRDGARLYISNEDVATASVVDVPSLLAEMLFMLELVRLLVIYLQEHRVAVDFMFAESRRRRSRQHD